MNKENKLIKNSLIFAVGNIGTNLITFFMIPYYTFKFSQAQYGEIELINSVIPLIVILISCNLSAGVFRFSLDKNYDIKKIFSGACIYSVGAYLIAVILFFLFKFNQYNNFYIIILIVFFSIIQSIFKELVRAIGKINIFIFSDIFHVLIFTTLNIIFISKLNLEVRGFFLAKVIACFIEIIFLFIIGKTYKYFKFYIDKKYIKDMIFYGLPLIPNALMWWIGHLSDRYVLNYYIGLEAVGLYSVASKFPTIINTINGIFFKAWQISAVEEYGNKTQNEFYTKVFNIVFIFIILLSSGFLMLVRLVMLYMVDEKFYSSWEYIPLLLSACIFSIFGIFVGVTYVASKETINAVKTMGISSIINLLLNFLLVPIYKIQGACFATMVSSLLFFLIRAKDTQKYVQIKYNLKNIIINFIMLGIQILFLLSIKELQQSTIIQFFCFIIFILINKNYIKMILEYIYKRGKIK